MSEKRKAMERRLGLDTDREWNRAKRHRECEARGRHDRRNPPKQEMKTLGGEQVLMELCSHCDVWVEPDKFRAR